MAPLLYPATRWFNANNIEECHSAHAASMQHLHPVSKNGPRELGLDFVALVLGERDGGLDGGTSTDGAGWVLVMPCAPMMSAALGMVSFFSSHPPHHHILHIPTPHRSPSPLRGVCPQLGARICMFIMHACTNIRPRMACILGGILVALVGALMGALMGVLMGALMRALMRAF